MSRAIHKLTARAVDTISKHGRHSDGGGLYLSISADGRRRWVFLYTWRGRLREAGLGPASKGGVSLKAARDKAAEGRTLVKAGVDPITEWNWSEAAEMPTFGKTADAFLAARSNEWRNEKHKAQWTMTLTRYCEAIRNKPVDAIDTEAVLSVLQPLWKRAPETASRLRGRIEAVLDASKARGLIGRNEANPARWRGHLDKLLPKRAKLDSRPPRGHALRGRSGFHRRASRAARDSGARPGILHSDRDAISRSAGGSLGRNRPRHENLDGPACPNKSRARASQKRWPALLERRTLGLNQEDFRRRWDSLPKGGDSRCRSRIRLICVSALSAMSMKVIRATRPRRISGCRFPLSSTW